MSDEVNSLHEKNYASTLKLKSWIYANSIHISNIYIQLCKTNSYIQHLYPIFHIFHISNAYIIMPHSIAYIHLTQCKERVNTSLTIIHLVVFETFNYNFSFTYVWRIVWLDWWSWYIVMKTYYGECSAIYEWWWGKLIELKNIYANIYQLYNGIYLEIY